MSDADGDIREDEEINLKVILKQNGKYSLSSWASKCHVSSNP